MTLLAYTKGITKEQFVTEMKKHQQQDNFLRQVYWNKGLGKGCAVGCSLKSINKIKKVRSGLSNHKNFEKYLGIPEWLARLEDTLFEGVSLGRSKTWPVEFSEAINEGSDLEKCRIPFIVFILQNNIETTVELVEKFPQLKEVLVQVAQANNQTIQAHISQNEQELSAAKSAARSAEYAAMSAAESAAKSAARSAECAARSAAWSAKSAAWSAARSAAESAAWSAAWSAARSAAESAAWSAARSAASSAVYEKFADKLLEFLRITK